ncbi:unnamed protein product [Calicophoron daubneyi]|uniref:Uncharacterized protein n=1 Tax=Calicophoron daubneyi TaxID=300641 RepID=A0AAV2TB06_CALDB
MNRFGNDILVFFVAFLSSLTAADATDYIIPDACRTEQEFTLNGSTMSGSTFIYNNTLELSVRFQFFFREFNSQNATVNFNDDTGTRVYNKSFNEKVEKKSINFSLSENWSAGDSGLVTYYSADRRPEDCNNRTATNLLVRGVYEISQTTGEKYSIRAREFCGVNVTLHDIYPVGFDPCNVTLKFSDGKTFNESSINETATSVKSPIYFDIYSDCDFAVVILLYQEDCRSTTASGIKVVANALPVTFALVLSMVQWL